MDGCEGHGSRRNGAHTAQCHAGAHGHVASAAWSQAHMRHPGHFRRRRLQVGVGIGKEAGQAGSRDSWRELLTSGQGGIRPANAERFSGAMVRMALSGRSMPRFGESYRGTARPSPDRSPAARAFRPGRGLRRAYPGVVRNAVRWQSRHAARPAGSHVSGSGPPAPRTVAVRSRPIPACVPRALRSGISF